VHTDITVFSIRNGARSFAKEDIANDIRFVKAPLSRGIWKKYIMQMNFHMASLQLAIGRLGTEYSIRGTEYSIRN